VCKHLDERVLDRLVGVRGVAKILKGDAEGAPLVARDQVGETLPRLLDRASLEEAADLDGQLRVFGALEAAGG
jgi:hypothetical protein